MKFKGEEMYTKVLCIMDVCVCGFLVGKLGKMIMFYVKLLV